MKRLTPITVVFGISLVLCANATSLRAQEIPNDYQEVLKSLDRKGDFKAGVLKVNIPRSDLKITIQGVATPTPFGFGGWVALTKGTNGTDVMMGDLVLLQEEVNPVMSALLDNGIEITALHNHFFWDDPHVFYMHVHGLGKAIDLAHHLKPALDLIGHVTPSAVTQISGTGTPLDTEKLAKIVGHAGEQSGAVYKITVGRDDLAMKDHGAVINARMGLNTWAAFFGTQEDAIVAGDVAMLENEVTPVLKTLRKSGLDVVAIHHHMTEDRPLVIFLHYWGRGPAEKLATAFKAALDNLGAGHAGMLGHSDSTSPEAADIMNAVKVTAQKDCGCGQCAAKGCGPCKGKNCHYCVAKALVVKDCGCGGCDAKGCSMCGPGCDVCKFHLAPNAAASPSDAGSAKPN
jgi:hypothetical protein